MSKIPTLFSAAIVALSFAACKQEEPPPPPTPSIAPLAAAPKATPPAAATGELPPGHPPIGAATTNGMAQAGMPVLPKSGPRKMLETAPTTFAGIKLTPPAEWKAFDASGTPMAPIAAFVLAAPEGATGEAEARLTHFPNMQNMPVQANLDRWFGQVQQPDGKPTKDAAKVETFETGGAKITVADMSGTIGSATDQRMIGAIIEHPQGPHFLKVTGPQATVDHWHDSVMTYLKSAQVEP